MNATGVVRLNPFAFVSDTALRFTLLLIFVIAADVRYWHGSAVRFFNVGNRLTECLNGAPALGTTMFASENLEPLRRCVFLISEIELPALGLGLALLAASTLVIYFLIYPALRVRQRRLTRLGEQNVPPLSQALFEASRAAGLRRTPEFWWNPLGSWTPLVFGHVGRYRVALSGATARLFFKDRQVFQAFLLHELAHIQNGDIDKTYLALSVFWAFLATALPPYLVLTGLEVAGWSDFLMVALEVSGVSCLVLLTRNSILRARELYADVGASAPFRDSAGRVCTRDTCAIDPAGVIEGLHRAIKGFRPIPWWRRLFSTHPDPARRLRLLRSTDVLFRLGFWDAFGAGVAAGVAALVLTAFTEMVSLVLLPALAESWWLLLTWTIVQVAIFVPLALGAASIATWRGAFLALMRGRKPSGALILAFGLAAGVMLVPGVPAGTIVTGMALGNPGANLVQKLSISYLELAAVVVALALTLTLALTAGLLGYLKWLEVATSCWLPVALGRPSAGVPFWCAIAVGCILALPWFSVLTPLVLVSVAQSLSQPLEGVGLSGAPAAFWRLIWISDQLFPLNAVAWASLIALWAFPLSASLWSRPASVGYGCWAFLDKDRDTGEVALAPVPLRPGRAALIGAIGGLLFGIAMHWLPQGLSPKALQELGIPEATRTPLMLSMIVSCIAAQGLIAAVVAASIPQLSFIHGMFGAFVAGCILGMALWVQLTIAGIMPPAILFRVAMIGGGLLALPSALGGWLLAAPVHAIVARGTSAVVTNRFRSIGE